MLTLLLIIACNRNNEGKVVMAEPEDTAPVTTGHTGDTYIPPDTVRDTDGDTAETTPPVTTEGIDVAQFDVDIDWTLVRSAGYSFVFIKATEGNYYRSSEFDYQMVEAYGAGFYVGAYHFATPDSSGAADQVIYFVDHGGDWTSDGQTLPGVLDLEYNPYGDVCYGMTSADLMDWVTSFMEGYRELTGRDVVIYTTQDWWDTCIGATDPISNPLWVADYEVSSPAIPEGWEVYQFWQWDSQGEVPGIDGYTNLNHFSGSVEELTAFVNGE